MALYCASASTSISEEMNESMAVIQSRIVVRIIPPSLNA